MPVNGFVAGKRVWIEVVCGSMRADFLGVIGHITEMEDGYHIEFRGGFSVSFTEEDLRLGKIIAHDHDEDPREALQRRRKTDGTGN